MPLSARAALLSIIRHRGASMIAVITLALMLSALTIFIVIGSGLNNAASGLEAKANLIADLKSNVSAGQAGRLETEIRAWWPQSKVSYFGKQQAIEEFRKTFAGNSTMLAALEGNPLPDSVQIRASNPLILTKISSALSADSRVLRIIYNPNLTHKLVAITDFVTIGGVAVVLALAFLALVIVVNTTHLAIEARREEIEVMKLVGATHAFVRNPLIIEGVLLGLGGAILASIVAMGLFLPVLKSVLGGASAFGSLLPVSSGPSFLALLGAVVVVAGGTIGALGSYVSVRRFAYV